MTRVSRNIAVLLAAIPLLLASSASARVTRLWSPAELLAEADLVLIGTVVSTADAQNHSYDKANADTWVAVDTVFQVHSLLKGEHKEKMVTVRHHRYFDPKAWIEVIDGPVFIQFNPERKNQYVIYLKRGESGEYTPLTGQYDPDNSFFKLTRYHHAEEEQEESSDKASAPDSNPFPVPVSLVNLISNREKYDGKRVAVRGFLALDFEGSAIYLHQDDYENGITKNGLWCTINLVKFKEFDHTYVSLTGTFDAKSNGHLGLWSGTIGKIERVWSPTDGKSGDKNGAESTDK